MCSAEEKFWFQDKIRIEWFDRPLQKFLKEISRLSCYILLMFHTKFHAKAKLVWKIYV